MDKLDKLIADSKSQSGKDKKFVENVMNNINAVAPSKSKSHGLRNLFMFASSIAVLAIIFLAGRNLLNNNSQSGTPKSNSTPQSVATKSTPTTSQNNPITNTASVTDSQISSELNTVGNNINTDSQNLTDATNTINNYGN